MMPPDVAAALAAERRGALMAEASRRRARADLALHRRLARNAAPPVEAPSPWKRLVAAWRLRAALRAAGPPAPPRDCSTIAS